jgi:glycosyltransferase involved in cell wall biosynthesis
LYAAVPAILERVRGARIIVAGVDGYTPPPPPPAFAFGVPIVATHVGGLAEYVLPERTGLIVAREDPRALADAVTRVVLDRDLRERLRSGIERASSDELNWDRTVDTLVNFYSECRLHRRQARGDIEENHPGSHARHRVVRPSGRRTR